MSSSMAFQSILVTPSTSLILIKNLSTTANVFLSTLNAPDFKVTVRDTTGLASDTSPINISTIGGAYFVDGSSYYALNNPYGLVNLSLRTSTTWQVLHTSGQDPAESAANVNTINISTMYVGVQSSLQTYVSSLTVQNLAASNSITITGPFVITNLSTPGFVILQSTLNVYGNVFQAGNLYVSGPTNFLSSAFIGSFAATQYPLYVSSILGVGDSVFVGGTTDIGSTLRLQSTAQVSSLLVNKITGGNAITLAETLQVANVFTLENNLAVAYSTVAQTANLYSDVSTIHGDIRMTNLTTTGDLRVSSNLSTLNSVSFFSSFLTNSSFFVGQSAFFLSSATIYDSLYTNAFVADSISSIGNISSTGPLTIQSTLTVGGNASTTFLSTLDFFSVGKNIIVGNDMVSTIEFVVASNVSVKGDAILPKVIVDTLAVGNDVNSLSLTIPGSVNFLSTLNVTNDLFVGSRTELSNNVTVISNLIVENELFITGNSVISSFGGVKAYALQQLDIITSSPGVAFETSTLLGFSTIDSQLFWTKQDIVMASSFYTSSLTAYAFFGNSTTFSTAYTDALYILPSTSIDSLGNISQLSSLPSFFVNMPTYFYKGISSMGLQTDQVNARVIQGGIFVGDGANLTNITYPTFDYISSLAVFTSTLTANEIFTNSTISGLFRSQESLVRSTLLSEFIVILPEGNSPGTRYSTLFGEKDYNSFVGLQSNGLAINNTLFFDKQNLFVGIGTSSPTVDLDVSGGLYCYGVRFSSINDIFVSTNTAIGLDILQASSITIRDYFQYGTISTTLPFINGFDGGGLIFPMPSTASNSINNTVYKGAAAYIQTLANFDKITPFISQVSSPPYPNFRYGIFDVLGLSSIVIGTFLTTIFSPSFPGYNDLIFLPNNLHKMLIGYSNKTPTADLEIYTNTYSMVPDTIQRIRQGFHSSNIYSDEANVTNSLITKTLHTNNLYMFGVSSPTIAVSTNQITVYQSTMEINNLLSIQYGPGNTLVYNSNGLPNYQNKYVGIKKTFAENALDVMGNAYFSTLTVGQLLVSSLTLKYQTL